MNPAFEEVRPEDYLTRLAASELGRSYKSLALSELAVRPGDTVLDLGCGPGDDLAALARSVGGTGLVIGLDIDDEHVAQARTRAMGLPQVRVDAGDIHRIALDGGSVDRAHTDRVLQHVADPATVLAEVCRVLRPGGRAVFAEPDWDTLVIDYPDLSVARAYTRFVTDRVVRNPGVGRQLCGLATRTGLVVENVVPITSVFLESGAADRVLGLRRVTERAVEAGYLASTTADEWLDRLATKTFFASATLFVVAVTRPGPVG